MGTSRNDSFLTSESLAIDQRLRHGLIADEWYLAMLRVSESRTRKFRLKCDTETRLDSLA